MNHLDTFFWTENLVDPSGVRISKPRSHGLTMVIDKGLSPRTLTDFLSLSSPYVDFIKLGFGTSVLYPPAILQEKLRISKEAGIVLYPGGTFFEVAYQQKSFSTYLDSLEALGFNFLEISDGTIEIPPIERCHLIRQAKKRGFHVITECGKKDNGFSLSMNELEKTLYSDLECGATYVIVEGRETGMNVGIYDKEGDLDMEFLQQIQSQISPDFMSQLIWEAPQKKQQISLIHCFGRNVNLGNISESELYSLECLRRGLRSDTFLR